MATTIIVLMLLAMFHFMYDGIILPSIRQHLRNKLFALRDRLRLESIHGLDKSDQEAFTLIHDAINTFVNRLPMLTVSVHVEIDSAIQNNPKLKEKITKRRKILENCKSREIKQINNEFNTILLEAFVANTGGWMIYIVPIACVVATWKRIVNDSKKMVAMPHQDIGKIIPETDRSIPCI